MLTNHGMDFSQFGVSHTDVAARVRELAAKQLTQAEKDVHGCPMRVGGIDRRHSDYFSLAACDLVASWLESNHGSKGVGLVCETQLILPEYLSGRKKSHWPYKLVRAESPEELANDMSNNRCLMPWNLDRRFGHTSCRRK